ncbi:unnamed protein product [Didymodactylos carnosus]|uniref:Methyltransferase FkbM domain-containing protein n=1 Tax=Didymodactylos carnosus TaxID=1234261 RepID=A0A814YT98_9BILA|nr:unnamed protein product [Didymodactylos carnosus]CAF1442540.1 unnamed protein product [Didymodactylos carnosus]CAF3996728.1 unnamed protein product [Didymodactylos carnosus]CAF4238709.1 unnamed protein product [Didymodactylos carnosus]
MNTQNTNSVTHYNCFHLLIVVVLLIIIAFLTAIPKNNGLLHKRIEQDRQNVLDDCRYIYIDLGTNIGIQIRKLYEPKLYPNSPVLPLFQKIFGNHSAQVCSVGFEANPIHTAYLKKFEKYCWQRNWKVKIYTSTAVSTIDGNVTFFTSWGQERHYDSGASLSFHKRKKNVTIQAIDLVSWWKREIHNRKRPPGSPASRIMMKSDIEGHDMTVISHLILHGIYCSIDLIYGEHISKVYKESIKTIQRHSTSCKAELILLDDERYNTQKLPFRI